MGPAVVETGTFVTLVDSNGTPTGYMEKLRAHQEGHLHEAFSVLVFNDRGELLLQQRAEQKYHSAGKWSNTCCSHPDPFEQRSVSEAARERLDYEMGFSCDLELVDSVYYREELQNGLVEHEYDHILVGQFSGDPEPNRTEVQAWRWIRHDQLIAEIQEYPEKYSAWLRHIIKSNLAGVAAIR